MQARIGVIMTVAPTPESVATLLHRRCIGLGGDVEPIGHGDFCHAFLVNRSHVVRIARHAEAAEAIRREACLLPRIAAHLPLPVPRPEYFPATGAEPAITIHEIVPGPPLSQELYSGMAMADRGHCAGQVGEFLAALHALDLDAAATCAVPRLSMGARAERLRDAARQTLSGHLDSRLLEAALRSLSTAERQGRKGEIRPVLLHGDLDPGHVLYDPGRSRVTGIIDFGDVQIGDAAWDFAYIFADYGLDFLGRCLARYPADDRASLLQRMQVYLEVDAIGWAVRCASGGDVESFRQAIEHLGELYAVAASPPWRALL